MRSFRGDPKAAGDSSRGIAAFRARFGAARAVAATVLALGVAGAILLVAAELTNLVVVDVAGAGCEDAVADRAQAEDCEITGGEQHSWALAIVAAFAALMAVGAGLGGSRPAGAALVVAGAVVLGIALIGDLPDTSSAGQVAGNFEDAEADAGPALWLELAGGGLTLLAGLLRLLARGRPPHSRATSAR